MEQHLDKHYGIRLGIIILVWFALGGAVYNSDNQQSFFSALILFLLPITLDYNSQLPKEEKNKKRQSLGIWSTVFLSAVFIGVLFSGFNIEFLIMREWVKILVWIACLFYVGMACIDWVAYSSPEEISHRERIKEIQRSKENNHETFISRVEYHKVANEKDISQGG